MRAQERKRSWSLINGFSCILPNNIPQQAAGQNVLQSADPSHSSHRRELVIRERAFFLVRHRNRNKLKMGRPPSQDTAEERRLRKNRINKMSYAKCGHARYKLSRTKILSPVRTPSSSNSDDDDANNASLPTDIRPNQLPLLQRLFDSSKLRVQPRLHVIYSMIFLSFLSSNVTRKTLALIYRITKLILAVMKSSGSKHNQFNRLFEHYQHEMFGASQKHFYCRKCKQLVDTENPLPEGFVCECGFPFHKLDNYFSSISVRQALTNFLETTAHKLHYFVDTDAAGSFGTFTRCSGIAMRRLNIRHDATHRDLAIDLFIDNAMVSKSGKKSSATIVQFSVANTIQHICRSRIILSAIWYARSPDDACPYSTILSTIVDQLLDLHEKPIVWTNGDQVIESRVFLRAVITDMKAKACVLGMKQFNGYYSCPYCIHKGTTTEKYAKLRVPVPRGTRKQARHDRVEANLRHSSASNAEVSFDACPTMCDLKLISGNLPPARTF